MGAFKEFFQKGKKIQFTDNLTIGARIITFLSEMIATGILMFIGCMGGVKKMMKTEIPLLHHAWAFGISVIIAVQIFGHISGSHINPVVSITAFILGNLSLIQFFVYFIGQLLGAIGGFGLLVLVSPPYALGNQEKVTLPNNETYKKPGVCSPFIHVDISIWQAFLTEYLASLILSFVCCGIWDKRNSTKMETVSIKFGMIISGLAMTVLFWAAPMLAGIVGAFTYKILFEQPSEVDPEEKS